MTRKLYRHPKALSDVEGLAVYIAGGNLDAAFRFLDAVEETMQLLLANPELGPARTFNQQSLSGLRSFSIRSFGKHLVFYRPTEHGIEVLRVLHGARDLGAIFDE